MASLPPCSPAIPSSNLPFTILPVRENLPELGAQIPSQSPPCLTGVSASELLASYLVSPKSTVSNPNLGTVPITPNLNSSYCVPSMGPVPNPPSLSPSLPSPSPAPATSPPVPAPQTWSDKAKFLGDKTLKRMSVTSTTISPEGIPRVTIPDDFFQQGALLHKDFIVGRFFGRVPAFKTIQNVLNFLWGKNNKLEIHLIPTTRSMIVHIPNDYIR